MYGEKESELLSKGRKTVGNPKLTDEEFEAAAKEFIVSLDITEEDDTDTKKLLKLMLRLKAASLIDVLYIARAQREINKQVSDKLKESGRDVTELERYIDKNIKPYFPSEI